jgi:phosphatidate cytidylyltransferase
VLRTRLLTAAVAVPALCWLIYASPAGFFAGFIGVVTAIGLYEYFAMALPGAGVERAAGMVWGLAVAVGVISQRPALWGAGLGLAVVGGLVFTLLHPDALAAGVNRLGLTLLGVLYVGFFTPHVVLLRALPDGVGWRWVFYAVASVFGSDTGGYFTGRAYGRHKLMPAVSPSKTVEGAIGALVGAGALGSLFRLIVRVPLGAGEAVAVSLVISVLAQFGDLCESALKRAFGAKDSGWIIPGHGGILDRLDSLLFPFVFAYYYAALPRG